MIGSLDRALNGRKKEVDLSHLRVAIIDEVDFFFSSNDYKKQLNAVNEKHFS